MNASPDLLASIQALAMDSLGGRVQAIEPIAAGLGPRQFFRIGLEGARAATAIARVDAPEDPSLRPSGVPPEPDFEAIRAWLAGEGLPVPRSFGRDPLRHIDLIEDLGSRNLEQAVRACSGADRRDLYRQAVELVGRLQRVSLPAAIPTAQRHLDPALFRYKASQVTTWLLPWSLGREARDSECRAVVEGFEYIGRICASAPQRVAHRDFQSTNLLVREPAEGRSPLAMIDFQGAFLAPPEYDLVCLLRDPHVELPEEDVQALLAMAREELPDCPPARAFETRFDLLTLTRCGKDLARYRYAIETRGDTRFEGAIVRAARTLRAAAERTAALESELEPLCELFCSLPSEAQPDPRKEVIPCER